jgi:nitroreductase
VLLALLLSLLAVRRHVLTAAPEENGDTTVPIALMRMIFPSAERALPADDRSDMWTVYDADRVLLGTALSTSPSADSTTGYAGPVPLLIGLDQEGRIVGVEPLPNSETRAFIDYIREEGYFDAWDGLTVAEALEKRVDAVSGATMSSSAMGASLRVALARSGSIAAAVPPEASSRVGAAPWFAWGAVVLSLLMFAAPRRLRRLRFFQQILNVVVLGFWAGFLLSLSSAYGWLANGVTLSGLGVLFAVCILAILLPLLTGRDYYCTHLCPYGSAQDLASRVWFWRRVPFPRIAAIFLRVVRGCVLSGAFLFLLYGLSFDLSSFEPFAAFQYRSAPVASLVLAFVFLALALPFARVWCRYACPTGFLLRCSRAGRASSPVARGRSVFRGVVFLLFAASAWVLVFSLPRPIASKRVGGERTMPDVLSVIHSRKSVRRYTRESVTREQLETLLRAGMAAPTAGNAQPWEFVVLTERGRMDRIADGFEYGKMLYNAAAAIIVCGSEKKTLPGEYGQLWVQDCSAAAENILLAAEGTGLGAVWVGCYPFADRISLVREVAGIPEFVTPLCVISIGHPTGSEKPKAKFKSENIHWETW